MHELIQILLNRARSQVGDDNAIVQLALILENNTVSSANYPYEGTLSQELLAVRLDKEEQQQVVANLFELIRAGNPSKSTIYWAIGKATGEIALAPLVKLIQSQSYAGVFDEETAWQALIALENFIEVQTDGALPSEVSSQLLQVNLRATIRQMAKLNIDNPNDPRHSRLIELAERILSRLGT